MSNISLKKGQVLKAPTVHFYLNFHWAVPPPPPHPSTLLAERFPAWLVCRVVGLFTLRFLTGRKETNYASEKPTDDFVL